ncbi:hypothetical protein [Micromonospora coerulea]|uniref:hypothetical protein n=1 Tax=Micromonospora coerulea TaxID=47856 RepID=UPI00190760BD|nr:hypothetical protein [Micromonospora veneta]
MKINCGTLLVAAVALVVAAGCFGAGPDSSSRQTDIDLKAADVVGVWQNDKDGSVLQFDENGSFAATNLPYQKFIEFGVLPDGFDGKRDKLPGSGRWSTDTALGYPEGPQSVVNLRVRVLAGRSTAGSIPVEAEGRDGETVLVFYVGDPDLNNRILYRRCLQGCPTVTPKSQEASSGIGGLRPAGLPAESLGTADTD